MPQIHAKLVNLLVLIAQLMDALVVLVLTIWMAPHVKPVNHLVSIVQL